MSIKPLAFENNANTITPNWPAADNIRAFCTTRNFPGNVKDSRPTTNVTLSDNAYDNFNLALHVDDDSLRVKANRRHLVKQFNLPHEPVWLDQVHGCELVNIANVQTRDLKSKSSVTLKADAAFSHQPQHICSVMTADCLPVLICNKQGNKVAAAHAGWRGLSEGVIETAVLALDEAPDNILVWLGPAIGADVFEVGEEVRNIFVNNQPESIIAFKQNKPKHYMANIAQLARLRLQRLGVEAVYGGEYCTYTDESRFYSFRRDVKTGRQASLIWFE